MTDTIATVTVVHEGRGGHIEVDGRRYLIEHVEGGRFSIHVPSGGHGPDLDALEALCRREPEKWSIERRAGPPRSPPARRRTP